MAAHGWNGFKLLNFNEQAIGSGSNTEAVAYIQIETNEGTKYWGVGQDTDITMAGLKALVSAYNRSATIRAGSSQEKAGSRA